VYVNSSIPTFMLKYDFYPILDNWWVFLLYVIAERVTGSLSYAPLPTNNEVKNFLALFLFSFIDFSVISSALFSSSPDTLYRLSES
jgi:hypothetical protein